jgi:hypothetical protein
MNNLDDLKSLWHTAKTDSLPTAKEMMQLIRKFRNQKLRSKWLVIISSLVLGGLITGVMFYVHFKLFTTYVGSGLMAFSSLVLAMDKMMSIKRFYQLDDHSNIDFLAFIEQTRKNQVYYYTQTMVTVVFLCSVGLLLYVYELTYQHPLWCIGAYSFIAVYYAILWFVIRPRAFRRDAEKLDATRRRIESILNQLK